MGVASSLLRRDVAANTYQPLSVTNNLPQRYMHAVLTARSKSVLGTLDTPSLAAFQTDNPLPNGYPWSLMNLDTNYYNDHPRTGVIRRYDFTVSRNTIAPDGYQVDALLVNGAFPAPLMEANWGDTIQVTVRNNISTPDEGTALHWHGFLQTDKPWQDGVPAVTQCPIPPGKSFTYSFEAELYGTAWYHSHYSAQSAGGLFGPIVIHGPTEKKYDIDIGPVMLTDWFHKNYNDLVEEIMQPNGNGIVFSSNNLINGKNAFDCSTVAAGDKTPCVNNAGVAKFRFQSGKTHRLRLINTGPEALQRFSIDGHNMTVIANDFVTVKPYTTNVVTLGVGQRVDAFVKADGPRDGAYWMRANISTKCSLTNQPNALAAVYYDEADVNKAPESTPWDVPDPGTCANDDLELTRPTMQLRVPEPDLTYVMEAKFFRNETGHPLWSFDRVDFRGNYNSPTLLMSHLGNYTFEKKWNVRNTKNARSVRVHPMHLHGFNMYILHEGSGPDWDGTIIHPENPQRRDVIQLRPNGHLVMQFDASQNPGTRAPYRVWPFHCHIAWHVSAGFFTQFVTGADALKKMRPPSVVAETCRQWGTWTNTNIPMQIDSGL
ncbi:laccase-1 precursor [Purpureocillium lilacinum]|uniref:Laccase-1 n=1 Tax=Purpureocillium lilacinum TaxID=33203 RepID=A0A179F890_PURLI|nr:laccase-1 precursor [Purpureocillium lilacinum]OAQ61309.1 laccase-1 precursor [Purpureocillium lilacinum]